LVRAGCPGKLHARDDFALFVLGKVYAAMDHNSLRRFARLRLVKKWFFLDTGQYSWDSRVTFAGGDQMNKLGKIAGQLSVFALMLGFCMPLLAAPASFDVAVETTYSDNLSETEDSMDNPIEGVHSRVSAALHKTVVLSEKFSMMGRIGLGYHQYHIDQSADYWSASAAIAANYRPFPGFYRPYFKLSLSAREQKYRNEFHPDQIVRAKFSVNKQWTPNLLISAGFAAREGYDEWPVVDTVNFGYWDTSLREIFMGMDLRVKDLILYGEVSRSEGDLIWTVAQGANYVGLLWDEYTQIDSLELGVNIPLSSHSALDLQGSFSQTRYSGSKMYNKTSLSLAYMHRFSL
jgi:hypothetical protein